ncbi:MAG: HlyD family efflux transporter periplasmic adaptor subunit [Candidatus Hydrogenedentes bacterium]|nr:HlyD family efflux transporter periplasmic adaptor subunit [Candidatus Hydrogenedentota bacterium]
MTRKNHTFHAASRIGFIRKKMILWLSLIGIILVVVLAISGYFGERSHNLAVGATFTAFAGPMEITVLEGGSIEAKDSLQIQSEVQGTTRILTLIDEGYLITPQDVEQGLILIELDSKDLVDRQLTQELDYQSSLAAFTEASEEYAIQENQNESDIKTAELAVHFSRMDSEKYLGVGLCEKLLDELGLVATEEKAAEAVKDVVSIDFGQYADPEKLGDGEARQKFRQLEDDLELANQDLGLAENKLEGTKRLYEREFVMKTQLDTEESGYNRRLIARQSADTNRDLYIKYEFPKMAQQLLSDYEESLRKLVRAQKLANSKIAQSLAKKNSAEARHELQARKREELTTQIEKCTIRAPRPGLVVYGTGERGFRADPIEEGASVRERQVLLTIPDTSVMAMRVQVHESFVTKVKPGQRARIKVDAYPNQQLTGVIHRIGVLPDSQNRWLSPDLKVYSTIIHIDDEVDWLKPGMSAEAEIIIATIDNALQVPVNAVQMVDGKMVCYVATILGTEQRVVQTGEYNISFIEVTEGLEPGEQVLLRAPKRSGEASENGKNGRNNQEKSEAPGVSPAPPEGGGGDGGGGEGRGGGGRGRREAAPAAESGTV